MRDNQYHCLNVANLDDKLKACRTLRAGLGLHFASEHAGCYTTAKGRRQKLELVIYTKPGCPYCQQARDYYHSEGIPFADYDAQNDRARRAEMLAFSGGDPTVPCIVENGKYKGSGWGDPPKG